MPKRTEKAGSLTARGDALRRVDGSNAGAQLHLKNAYSVCELSREATTEDFSVVRKEGARQVRRNVTCYDRFIIVDSKEVFWTSTSLKDAGRLTFAAAKMGAEIIPGLLESIRKATSERREYGKGKSKSRG